MEPTKFVPKSKAVDRIETALELAAGKDVLHIGIGGYVDTEVKNRQFLESDLLITPHARLAKVARSITGIDINRPGIEAMERAVPGEYLVADVTDPSLPEKLGRKYDAVMFLEVIQQLTSFRESLQSVKNLVKNDGAIVISTANAYCFGRFVKMLFRYESVHDEHTCYFSYVTLRRLLSMHDLAIGDFYYTFEKRADYRSTADYLGFNAMRALLKVFPQYSEGLLAVARATG